MRWLWIAGWGVLLLCAGCGQVTKNDAAMGAASAGVGGSEPNATAAGGTPAMDAGPNGEAVGTTAAGGGGREPNATSAGGAPPLDAGLDGELPPECADFVGRATPEQAAQTFRERPIAELLALDHASETDPVAPQEEYERIVADLDAMRAVEPDLSVLFVDRPPPVFPLPSWHSWTTAVIEFTELGQERVAAGSYSEWDCVNALYRVSEIDLGQPTWGVELTFGGYFNLPLILQDYAELPEVVSAEPRREIGFGSDVCMSREGPVATYIFWHAYGDCPAGCTEREFWGFRVTQTDFEDPSASGGEREVEYLGYVPDAMDNPEWFSAAEACLEFLR